ncbi:MAG TPA: ABC transporter substrate-binding protein [Candidatus Dormibacteraeota bacterium]|nr:ABC transporter substrate-binding protein [Candidatus Dormibacteraeota bacterium]
MFRRAAWALLLPVLVGACGVQAATRNDFVLGLVAPLKGESGLTAREDTRGVQVAVDEVNRQGGVQGRHVRLVARGADSREATAPAVEALKAAGAAVVMGSYSSQLSIPTAVATSSAGLVYWEAGAVADQVTGEALPRVFRVGAAGSNLGHGSAVFATEQLAPRLHRTVPALRITVVEEHDAYGDSVTNGVVTEATARGAQVAPVIRYDAYHPDWNSVFAAVVGSLPDVLVLASYIPDGVAFRREMLSRGITVGALIGTTMAECGPEFGAELGNDAIGVFASDRPSRGFNPASLRPGARTAYDLLVSEYQRRFDAVPGEEGIASFSAAWALLHHVLPGAASLAPSGIDAAAQAADLPTGSLPNGAGLRFSSALQDRGQNLRSASVIWQWQGYRHSVTVWPPVLATGVPAFVPLPR